MDYVIWVIGALSLIAVFVLIATAKRPNSVSVCARPLLTDREREAFNAIEAQFPQFRVFPQVAMGALLKAQGGLTNSKRSSVRNTFDRKIVDFVLEERATGSIFAIVELDDRTHNAVKDKARDEMTRAAGYRTIRLPGGRNINLAPIKEALAQVN